ncbi:19420_t:CDS:2 [Gigaspora margarita]|uniref:19420_t:CDS:1 n=1 Tax=Gigaspora margarita TaxID=4874 RepID=A0ABM8VWD7_GIGMA|nr:19420_t:CDS:2 [Gigaspora margarita]
MNWSSPLCAEQDAIAIALLAVPVGSIVQLYSDSKNAINLVKQVVERWNRRELKLQIEVNEIALSLNKIRAHNRVRENKRADSLAKAEIKEGQKLSIVSSWTRSMRVALYWGDRVIDRPLRDFREMGIANDERKDKTNGKRSTLKEKKVEKEATKEVIKKEKKSKTIKYVTEKDILNFFGKNDEKKIERRKLLMKSILSHECEKNTNIKDKKKDHEIIVETKKRRKDRNVENESLRSQKEKKNSRQEKKINKVEGIDETKETKKEKSDRITKEAIEEIEIIVIGGWNPTWSSVCWAGSSKN